MNILRKGILWKTHVLGMFLAPLTHGRQNGFQRVPLLFNRNHQTIIIHEHLPSGNHRRLPLVFR